MDNSKVSDFITNERNWDITSLNHIRPNNIINQIKVIPIPLMEFSDRHVRKFTSTGESSVKTTIWLIIVYISISKSKTLE